MIELRAMTAGEYATYLDYFIPDYADEIAANYGLSPAAARAQAEREIADDLPQGVDSVGQVLLCIVDPAADAVVGYLWYKPDVAARSAFIYDFHVRPAHQGHGLGSQALTALEDSLGRAGIRHIKLRVAGDNARARHVYDRAGFRVTGINMSKTIGAA